MLVTVVYVIVVYIISYGRFFVNGKGNVMCPERRLMELAELRDERDTVLLRWYDLVFVREWEAGYVA